MTTPKKERDMPQQTPPVKPRTSSYRNRSLAGLLAAGCCLLLAACGSSASGAGTVAQSTGGRPSTGPGPGSAGQATLAACMKKEGITLSAPSAGAAPTGTPGAGAPGAGGAPKLPAGVTQAQFQAAMKKCGGSFGRPGSPPSGSGNGAPPSGSGGPGGTQSAATPAPFKASGG